MRLVVQPLMCVAEQEPALNKSLSVQEEEEWGGGGVNDHSKGCASCKAT